MRIDPKIGVLYELPVCARQASRMLRRSHSYPLLSDRGKSKLRGS